MSEPGSPPFVHPTAVVEDGVEIGTDSMVWHHGHLRTGASIGRGCVFGKNVFVDAGVQIGDRCKIQNNVSVYTGVELADEVFVGPSAVFTNDRFPRAAASTGWDIVPTSVLTGASIGANATIVCGVTIGAWASVGAGSVVTKPVEPYELVLGNPARRHGWVCRCGRVLSRATEYPPGTTCDHCRFELPEHP